MLWHHTPLLEPRVEDDRHIQPNVALALSLCMSSLVIIGKATIEMQLHKDDADDAVTQIASTIWH